MNNNSDKPNHLKALNLRIIKSKLNQIDPYLLTDKILSNKYKLEAYAGSGGMGAVYLASEIHSGDIFAVKIIKPDIIANQPGYTKLFEQEVLSVKRLSHPNIVKIYDNGIEDNLSYMVMEWLDGESLQDYLLNNKLSLESTHSIFKQICSGLEEAHSRQIIHLDIKPGNIFLANTNGQEAFDVKIIDFGLAKILSRESGTTATKFRGTFLYCSPEQFGGKLSYKSDIYSLGATLYNMLTGVAPFGGASYINAKMHSNLELPQIPTVLTYKPELPRDLDYVLQTSLKRMPENRQQSVKELFQAYENVFLLESPDKRDGTKPKELDDSIFPISRITLLIRKFGPQTELPLAIQLTSSKTIIYAQGRGIVVAEPSIVAINKSRLNIEAIGRDVKELPGIIRNNVTCIRPIEHHEIRNNEVASHMMNHFINKAKGTPWKYPQIVIGIPTTTNSNNLTNLKKVLIRSNPSEAYAVDKMLAIAIGAGLHIDEPTGFMLVDINSNTTTVAVVAMSKVVESKTIKVGSRQMDQAITEYIKNEYQLAIDDRTSEAIKKNIGSASPLSNSLSMEIGGKSLRSKLPISITISDKEISEAITNVLNTIIGSIKDVLAKTTPELSADIFDRGIQLNGGGSLLKELDTRISQDLDIPVSRLEDPLSNEILGLGRLLSEDKPFLQKL